MPSTESVKHSFNDSGFIDSHCHLNDLQNLAKHFNQAQSQGIQAFIIPGTEPDQWPAVTATQNHFPHTFIAFGIHPWFVKNPELEIAQLETAILNNPVVAIGEIGLDYYPGEPKRPEKRVQLRAFELQLALAEKNNLPVIIHSVKAHQDCLAILKQYSNVTGVIHAFSGSVEIAQSYIKLGFKLGIGPLLLRSKKLQAAVAQLPLECLLLETDAPYMTKRKTENGDDDNPLLQLVDVAEKLAQLKNLTIEQVQQQSMKAAQQLFLE